MKPFYRQKNHSNWSQGPCFNIRTADFHYEGKIVRSRLFFIMWMPIPVKWHFILRWPQAQGLTLRSVLSKIPLLNEHPQFIYVSYIWNIFYEIISWSYVLSLLLLSCGLDKLLCPWEIWLISIAYTILYWCRCCEELHRQPLGRWSLVMLGCSWAPQLIHLLCTMNEP